MTAAADTAAGTVSISVALSGDATNIGASPLTVTTNLLTVIDAPSTIQLSEATSITATAGGSTASSSVTFTIDQAAEGGLITLTPTATGISFDPTSVDVAQDGTTSGSFTMTAIYGTATAGITDISVALSGAASNIGTNPLMVSTNKLRVLLTTPSFVELSEATSIVENGDESSSVYFLLDVAPTAGDITLTPSAPSGITFAPTSVTVSVGSLNSSTFKITAAAGTDADGVTDISVALTGTASNIGTTPLVVSNNKLTVVPAASTTIDTVQLSSTVTLSGGSTSSNLYFVLNVAPESGNVTLTPTASNVTFNPSSVLVVDGNTDSANFTMSIDAGITARVPAILVAITGSATNIDSTSLSVVPENLLIIQQEDTNTATSSVKNVSTVRLSKVVQLTGGSSEQVTFILDVAATGGSITLTPTAENITFNPTSISVNENSAESSSFTIQTSGSVETVSDIDVTISGDASNIGTTSFSVLNSGVVEVGTCPSPTPCPDSSDESDSSGSGDSGDSGSGSSDSGGGSGDSGGYTDGGGSCGECGGEGYGGDSYYGGGGYGGDPYYGGGGYGGDPYGGGPPYGGGDPYGGGGPPPPPPGGFGGCGGPPRQDPNSLFQTETEEYKVLSTWITDFDNDGNLDIVMHLFYTKQPYQQRIQDIELVGAQRIALFRGFRTGLAAQGSFVFPEPVDETATLTTTDDITRGGTIGAQATALDVDGDGDLDLLWFSGSTPFYRENIGSSFVPKFGNVQPYNVTAFDSIQLTGEQNIIADVADVNDDGRDDIVFTTVDATNYVRNSSAKRENLMFSSFTYS